MTRAENIFGTDGVRDRAGEGLLAPESLKRLGVAVAAFARRRHQESPKILFGRDTRPSGPEIEEILGRQLAHEGCHVDSAGVVPTPAVSLLVAEEGYDVGVVISASHNPPRFNGVKLFDRWGRKLDVETEQRITRDYHRARPRGGSSDPTPTDRPDLKDRYVAVLLEAFDGESFLAGQKFVLDCARGATASVAAEVFRRAGAEAVTINDEVDGAGINHDCGSLHPQGAQALVTAEKADLGFAFDGDGDRVILIDDQGKTVDGDDVLALWAMALRADEALPGDRIVATVMSNAGMERYLAENGIGLIRTPVGDREVFQGLCREQAVLGGEQSGHIIFSPEAATGDGIRTALHMARLVRRRGLPLSTLRAEIPRFPQVLLAVEVSEKVPFEGLPEVNSARQEAESALEGRGRVLLRYSGTEPVARVLVEGEDPLENEHWAERIADSLRSELKIVDG